MNAYELIQAKPHLHVFGDGTPRLMSLLDNALKWMADELSTRKDAVTLETGYGLTTVLMTMLARQHHSIAPDEPGYRRVLDYCKQQGIPAQGLQYHVGFSEDVLPKLDIPDESLDMVLIDGGHGIPTPFVDYAYTFKKIKVGGYLVVDDIQLGTGLMLKDFLLESKEWGLTGFFDSKTCAFRKYAATPGADWYQQPYMLQMQGQVDRLLAQAPGKGLDYVSLEPVVAAHKWTVRRAPEPAALESKLLPVVGVERLKLAALRDRVRKVAIFGAGQHTAWLEKILAGQEGLPQIVAVLDDAPAGKPARFGRPPVAAEGFDAGQVDAIVLSTDCLQRAMQLRCRALYGAGARLIDLYAGLPAGPYRKE